MLVIGLTGGIGSGKSTVARLFQHKGIHVIDADQVAREVVEPDQPALQEIANHFGKEIINQTGELRRTVLRELVFDDDNERVWLEQLLHPLINQLIRERIGMCSSPYCIVMSPLLLETTQKQMVDRILVIDVSRQTQVDRALARDASSRQTIEAIIDSQISREKRLYYADDIVNNDGDASQLESVVDGLHEKYESLSLGN